MAARIKIVTDTGQDYGSIGIGEHSAADSLLMGPASLRMAAGTVALDGTNPTPVSTGLTTIVGAVLTIVGSAAPADATSVLTYAATGGTLNIYGWMNTSGSDPTLVASTNTETVAWMAWGT